MIIRYIRNKKGELKGCVVRTDEGRLGYSLCHELDRLKNTKKLTRQIALDRAEKIMIHQDINYTNVLYSVRNGRTRFAVPHTVTPYLKELMDMPEIKRETNGCQ